MSSKKIFSLYEYDKQIAVAFKVDCEELLEEFEKLKSLRYVDFAKVWQLKNFTYVYSGQKYALLLRELCENYFYIVKKFIMFPGKSIFTQICGFYLLYGLYYKQPLKSWVKIRLTFEDYKKISELIEEMKIRGQYEAVYIFAKMKVDKAFVYTALHRPLGPEDRFVKSYESYLDYAFNSSKKDETFSKFNEIICDGDFIKQLESTNNEYQELMTKYKEKCPSLTLFPSTITKDLEEARSAVEQGEMTARYSVPPEMFDVGNNDVKPKSVKAKAMANKNAVYRGKKNVKTAIDLEFENGLRDDVDSDTDDDT